MVFLEYFQNKSFWESTKVVQDKDIKEILSNTLTSKNIKMKSEIILSAYLIHLFPNEVLSTELNMLENFIKEKSDNVVNIIEHNKIDENIELINNYENYFLNWKKKDTDAQLKVYLELYTSYKNMESIDCEEKTNLLRDLYEAIKFLSNNNQDKLIEECNDTNIRDSAINLHVQVSKQMKNAYWDMIKKDEINNDLIISWLKDVKSLFLEIYNLYTHSEKKIEILNEYIDIEFIQPQIKDFDIHKLLHWILNEAKNIDAPSYDNEYEEIDKEIDNKEYIKVVRFIFERLEDIKNFSVNTK